MSVRLPRLERLLPIVVVPLLVVAPDVARACAVCSAGRDEATRVAFLVTTIFLSVLPLALIGGVAWWLRRAVRRSQALAPGSDQPAR